MTTKNLDFEFDLQQFAVTSEPKVTSADNRSDTATISAVSGSSIAINAGWAVTDTTTTWTTTSDDTDTFTDTTTVYSHDDVFSYYAFSSSDSGVASIVAATANYSIASGTSVSSDTITAVPSGLFSDTVASASTSSPITLMGGGDRSHVSLQAVGYINDFNVPTSGVVIASKGTGTVGLNGVVGDIVINTLAAGSGTQFNQTLTANNNAIINATLSTAGAITIQGGNSGASPTLSADQHVHLGHIDTIQTWLVGNSGIDYSRVSLGATTGNITVTGASDGYLAATMENGVNVGTVTGSGSVADTISVNDTIITGVARTGAAITTDENNVMNVYVTNNSGLIGAGASLSGGQVSVNAGANIGIVDGVIVDVDTLAANGIWALSDKVTQATLGDDTVTFTTVSGASITADSNGTKVRTLTGYTSQVTVGAVDDHTITAGGATWSLDGADKATITTIFDEDGDATLLSGSSLTVKGGTAGKTLAIGANGDTLAANGNTIAIGSDSVISNVSSIEAGTSWLVRGGSNRAVSAGSSIGSIGVAFASADSNSVFGSLSKSTVSGSGSGVINAIDSLSGNVTVSHGATSLDMNVMGTNWTVANESLRSVIFDSTGGAASFAASSSDVSVTASASTATVNITGMVDNSLKGSFNGASVTALDDGQMTLQLESDATVSGISAITGLNTAATVSGDNQFNVNGIFDISRGSVNASADMRFSLGGNASITVQNVLAGDSYTVKGSNNQAVIYDIDATGTSGQVNINDASVSINAAGSTSLSNVSIVSGTDGSDIVRIGGVKANDAINVTNDNLFSVDFDTSNVTTDTAILSVNNVGVSLSSANLSGSSLSMTVDDSGATPYVTISSGNNGIKIGTKSTVTVGAGVYKVGQSAAVAITDPNGGYLYIDDGGNATGEDSVVATARRIRESEINGLVSNITAPSASTAFYDFENIYYGSTRTFSDWPYAVASYADATTTIRSSTAGSSGVVIYGDNSLNAYPASVTLRSYVPNAINIEHAEGLFSGNGGATLRNAVIDVSSSANTLVALGISSGSESFAVNHTILGSDAKSTLLVGPYARSSNVIRAGNGGNYIYHQVTLNGSSVQGGNVEIYGGDRSDTIYAANGDFVSGGGGQDYFYDTNAIQISDYNFDEADVIIASKLSANNLSPDNLKLFGNTISIADGATITVGGDDYSQNTATKAVIANANGATVNFLIWAGNDGSTLDASDFAKGALMISSINGGEVNMVTGSDLVDTIYAGPNDVVNSGAGNDDIYLAPAATGQNGATVILSEGRDNVSGWVGGFNNEAGANILQANMSELSFKMVSANNERIVRVESGTSAINFTDMAKTNGAYNFLVGENKVSYLDNKATVSVNENADIADYYLAEKAGGIYVSSSVDAEFNVTLGSERFSSITNVELHNENHSTVLGSAVSETIAVYGSADLGAGKLVASGGGNDLIISGGDSDSLSHAGNELRFGKVGSGEDATVYSSGNDIVRNFNFYNASEDTNLSHADLLYLGDGANFGGVTVTSSQMRISLGDDTRVVVEGDYSTSDNKIVRARFSNDETVYNCKFGVTSSNSQNNTFTYDGVTNFFYGNAGGRNRDTLNVDSEVSNGRTICLNTGGYFDGVVHDSNNSYYSGINAIDASNFTGSIALAGNTNSNTIKSAGGESSSASLWGGGGQSNSLVGGAGTDTFFYFKSVGYNDDDGNFHSSRDIISNVGTDDLIWLGDVTLADINLETTAEGLSSGRAVVTFNDGTELTVTGISSSAKFRISNGEGGWSEFRAVTSGSNRHWE